MFASKLALLAVVVEARGCARKTACPARITRRLRALLPAVALAMTGCGSSGNSVKAPPLAAPYVPAPGPGSSFVASPLMLSPDDGYQVNSSAQALAQRRQKALLANSEATTAAATTPAATTSAPLLNHWFYLVNGEGIPSPGTAATDPPNVLTVTGGPPNGAPGPNGGTVVSVTPLISNISNPNPNGSQLWKAVASPTPGYYFLRSAQSFKVNDHFVLPSLLTGFGATGVPLDLGYLSTYYTGIYFNFNDSPGFLSNINGDQPVNTSFQQWAYDSNAELTNGSTQGQLYNTMPTGGVGTAPAAVGTGTSAPSNQWYAYPNYSMERIVAAPNSSPPFPAADTPGETAAYEYMSVQFGVPQTESCPLEGTRYDGIRCEYNNLNTATVGTCASNSSIYSNPAFNPGAYPPGGTTISATDWAAVTTQLSQECQYAADVQATFSTYNQIINSVFTSASIAIPQLAIDVGVSDSQSLNVVPTEFIEGMLYSVLNVTGVPGAGALANLMETGVNTAVAADSNSGLTKPLATTVANLYSDLNTQFSALRTSTSNGETAILEDWLRLSQIGPLTGLTGYNGLGFGSNAVPVIETQALQGYELSVMQQLMPVSPYVMQLLVGFPAGTEATSSAWDEYSYPTFGSNTEESNIFWEQDASTNYPSQTVMQTDIADNGANLFDFFNGLNGWASLPVNPIVITSKLVRPSGVVGCTTVVMTLYNATPVDLWVKVTPDTGTLISPGNPTPGSGDSGTFELRPYGYLPIFTFVGKSEENGLDMNVTIFNSSSEENSVLSYTLASDGCQGKQLSVSNYVPVEGYVLQFANYAPSKSDPQGVWAVVQK